MRIVLDTNIIVHNANAADVLHQQVAERLRALVSAGAELCIAAQSVFEFWVVATRPVDVNGLGLAPADARRMVDAILESYSLVPDPAELVLRWLDLCEQHRVCGRQAHDARLAAWMLSHNLRQLLTLNSTDFVRFDGVECLGLE